MVEGLDLLGGAPVVVDPVMISESGATLLDPNAKAALIERVLPRATVLTPNLPEARALSGLGEGASALELGEALLALGPDAVVVTGGHADDGADLLVEAGGVAADRRAALSRRRLARLRLHPLLGARRLPRPRRGARRRRALGARGRLGGGRPRPARDRRAAPGPVDVFGIAHGAAPRPQA